MSSPTSPRTPNLYHAAFDPVAAVALTLMAMGVYFVAAIVAPMDFKVIAAQLGAGATVVVVARSRGMLGLVPPRGRHLVAGALVGISMWYVNLRVLGWVVELMHRMGLVMPGDEEQRLDAFVQRPSLWVALTTIALMPAVCEELIFRGVLARGLASKLPWPAAAALSAVMFSAYHLSVLQALPTLCLGFALATIALHSGSIIPTMIAHALNNAAAIVLSREDASDVSGALDAYPTLTFFVCLALTAAGLWLVLARGGPRR